MSASIRFLLLLLCCALQHTGHAQSSRVTTLDLVRDFGATRGANDQAAFDKASAYLNARPAQAFILNIPRGTYRFGAQAPDGYYPFAGKSALDLKGRTGTLTIVGNGATIKPIAGLRFGAFNARSGKAHEAGPGIFNDAKFGATTGSAVRLRECRSVRISNLVLDGASASYKRGGHFGDVGYQLESDGVGLYDCFDITLDGVRATAWGRDGFLVANHDGKRACGILIKGCTSEYNGRQGLSWIGGRRLVVQGSGFSHTGRGAVQSSPAAGVDVEAEWSAISDGQFTDCEMVANAGVGVLLQGGEVRDISFTRCTMWGTTSPALWAYKPGLSFTDCKIYGGVVSIFPATKSSEGVRFTGCTFEDKPYKGVQPSAKFLVEANEAFHARFSRCTFTANRCMVWWLYQDGAERRPERHTRMDDCAIRIPRTNPHSGAHPAFAARTVGVIFNRVVMHKPAGKNYSLNDCCHENNLLEETETKIVSDL